MHHVKSEHEKDDDDDLDDDRKPELGHHGHHSYYQHPMTMGGHYNNHHHSLKTEIDTISKNQTGSDCGVPIPGLLFNTFVNERKTATATVSNGSIS